MNLTLEIFIVILLILLNGVFSLSEIAIVSARKSRLQLLANKGNKRASVALNLANNPDLFLSTVQAGMTLVGILAGAYGGVTLSDNVTIYLEELNLFGSYAHSISLVLVVIAITYFTIIVGELLPKQLALRNAEPLALVMAVPMQTLSAMMNPVVQFLSFSTNILIRLFHIKNSSEPPVTDEEIKVMIAQGTKAGMFEEAEQDMVENVFRLGDKHANAFMTPRTEIIWLDSDDPLQENLKKISDHAHSFFPVCKNAIDNVIGILNVKDLLHKAIAGEPLSLESKLLRQPLFVIESISALQLLEQFKEHGTHLALLVDEYGGIQGIITINDILQAVVGEELNKKEKDDPYIIRRADGSFLIDGALLIDEFKEFFSLELTEEETGNYQTVAGFVINQMGKIPAAGQFFQWNDLRIEVIDMDGNRVDKLLIRKLPVTKNG
ncbi:MAG: HlyC/CorC family transporter [Bacteroidetes bacterium]|nr:HlyC/CorC family transporter [Bacteroidota bacterium]